MTPQEITARLKSITEHVGSDAYANVMLATDRLCGPRVSAILYPSGISSRNNHSVRVDGDSFEEMLDALEAEWAKASNLHDAATIEKMALEIIRQTALSGECTDAALRLQFSDDVDRYVEAATAKANEMADNGPFSVRSIVGNNGAPAKVEAA